MLEYYKIILLKVSFNSDLFEKELKKALQNVLPEETNELLEWVLIKFKDQYPTLLNSIVDLKLFD